MIKATHLLAFAALFVGGAAQASTFRCAGLLETYNFSLTGTIKGNKAVGSAVINVTEGGKPLRRAAMPIASSLFTPNQALQIESTDGKAKIVVNAQFQNGAYAGPMDITSQEGNISLGVTCTVK
jgi:hypothetical protein